MGRSPFVRYAPKLEVIKKKINLNLIFHRNEDPNL